MSDLISQVGSVLDNHPDASFLLMNAKTYAPFREMTELISHKTKVAVIKDGYMADLTVGEQVVKIYITRDVKPGKIQFYSWRKTKNNITSEELLNASPLTTLSMEEKQ